MFSNCTTLGDLNMARLQAAAKFDITIVNNAYNKRRAEIMQQRKNYNRIETITPELSEVIPTAYLQYAGPSSELGLIHMTSEGIFA